MTESDVMPGDIATVLGVPVPPGSQPAFRSPVFGYRGVARGAPTEITMQIGLHQPVLVVTVVRTDRIGEWDEALVFVDGKFGWMRAGLLRSIYWQLVGGRPR